MQQRAIHSLRIQSLNLHSQVHDYGLSMLVFVISNCTVLLIVNVWRHIVLKSIYIQTLTHTHTHTR